MFATLTLTLTIHDSFGALGESLQDNASCMFELTIVMPAGAACHFAAPATRCLNPTTAEPYSLADDTTFRFSIRLCGRGLWEAFVIDPVDIQHVCAHFDMGRRSQTDRRHRGGFGREGGGPSDEGPHAGSQLEPAVWQKGRTDAEYG